MYFKVKLLIWHYYSLHFLKVYLSVLRNESHFLCFLILFSYKYLNVLQLRCIYFRCKITSKLSQFMLKTIFFLFCFPFE